MGEIIAKERIVEFKIVGICESCGHVITEDLGPRSDDDTITWHKSMQKLMADINDQASLDSGDVE